MIIHLMLQQVAIPYKSGKYSYEYNNGKSINFRHGKSQSLINQGNILTGLKTRAEHCLKLQSRNPL